MGKIATEQEAAQIGRVINSNKKIVTVSELKNINCSSVWNYSNSQGVQLQDIRANFNVYCSVYGGNDDVILPDEGDNGNIWPEIPFTCVLKQDNVIVGSYVKTVDYFTTSTYNYELMDGSSKVDPTKEVEIEFEITINFDANEVQSVGGVEGALYSGTIDTSPIIEQGIVVETKKLNDNTFSLIASTVVTWEQLGLGFESDPDNYSNDLSFEFLFY